jgi:glycerol-3-phosphate acyltransferase PlsX
LSLGRVNGILRPALGTFLPAQKGTIFCLDLGANTDCKPEYLEQFAMMGSIYVRLVQKIDIPRVALLSNGHEPYKGSRLVKEVYGRLEKTLFPFRFVGNVEARDVFRAPADVIICDGFVGNIMLKTAQGTVREVIDWLKQESQTSLASKIVLFLAKPLLKRLKAKMDYVSAGGAILLGVTEPVIIAHGASDAQAIAQSIIFAHTLVEQKRIEHFNSILDKVINAE